jgi:hypothetical protein
LAGEARRFAVWSYGAIKIQFGRPRRLPGSVLRRAFGLQHRAAALYSAQLPDARKAL